MTEEARARDMVALHRCGHRNCPDVLRTTIAWCLAHRVEHLSMSPYFAQLGLVQGGIMGGLSALFMGAAKVPRPGDGDPNAILEVGAFNLVHRDALDRTPGFEWLRMELNDDLALA